MANELQGFAKFLRDTLVNDAGVAALVGARVYEDKAPQGATFPYLIFSLNRARDLGAIGQQGRIHVRPAYLVRGTVQDESYADADAIAAAVDTALEGAKGTSTVGGSTYQIRGVFHTAPVRYPETTDGVQYRHSGGIYEAFVHV